MKTTMLMKSFVLAAVSASAFTLFATQASAQATQFYNSPAQARTYDVNRPAQQATITDRRAVAQPRGVDAFAASRSARPQWSAPVDNVHPSIADY